MGVMEVHGTDSARSTGHAFTALVAYPCLLEQSCRTTHAGHIEGLSGSEHQRATKGLPLQ